MEARKIALEDDLEWYIQGNRDNTLLSQAHVFAHEQVRSRVKDVLQKLECDSNAFVLDVGCGSGLEIPFIREVTPSIIGVDISLRALVICKNEHNLPCVIADIKDLPVKSKKFNFVVIIGVLHHLVGQGDLKPLLTEIYRTVEKGGWIIAIEPNLFYPNTPIWLLLRKLSPRLIKKIGLIPHEKPLSPFFLKGLFEWLELNSIRIEAATYVYNRFPIGFSRFIAKREGKFRASRLLKYCGWWTVIYGQKELGVDL